MQYLQNSTCQDVIQGHFRKPLQGSTNFMKSDYPETAHEFFKNRSIPRAVLRLNCCYNC